MEKFFAEEYNSLLKYFQQGYNNRMQSSIISTALCIVLLLGLQTVRSDRLTIYQSPTQTTTANYFGEEDWRFLGSAEDGPKVYLLDGSWGAAYFKQPLKTPSAQMTMETKMLDLVSIQDVRFIIFWTKTDLTTAPNTPGAEFLGIGSMSDVAMLTYLYDEQKFYFCQWSNPIPSSASTNLYADYCSPAGSATIADLNSNTFTFEFAGDELKVANSKFSFLSGRIRTQPSRSRLLQLTNSTLDLLPYGGENYMDINFLTITAINYTNPVQIYHQSTEFIHRSDIFDNVTTRFYGAARGGSVIHLTDGSAAGAAIFRPSLRLPWLFSSIVQFSIQPSSENITTDAAFAIFWTKTMPTESQYNSAAPFVGLGDLSDVFMLAYNLSEQRFYWCNWSEPLSASTTDFYSSYCTPSSYRSIQSLNSDPVHLEWDYEYGMMLASNGQAFTLERSSFYFGVAANVGTNNIRINVKSWEIWNYLAEFNFDTNTFGYNTETMQYLGDAKLEDGVYRLNNATKAGAILWAGQADPGPQFTTSFKIRVNGEGSASKGGWFFFVTPAYQFYKTLDAEMWLLQRNNLMLAGYSSVFQSFVVCMWRGAPNVNFPIENCTTYSIESLEIIGGRTYTITLQYRATNGLTLILDGIKILTRQIDVVSNLGGYDYETGIFTAPTNNTALTIDIVDWSMQSSQQADPPIFKLAEGFALADLFRAKRTTSSSPVTPPVAPPVTLPPIAPPVVSTPPVTPPVMSNPPISAPVTSNPPITPPVAPPVAPVPRVIMLGHAGRFGLSYRLTWIGNEAGAVYYEEPAMLQIYFKSTFNWTVTNCDAVNNGADGFSFFFTPTAPTHNAVVDSLGGLLGIRNVPNVKMVAYSSIFNAVFTCNWTTPLTVDFRDGCVAKYLTRPRYTCNNSFNVKVIYFDSKLQLYINDELLSSQNMTFSSSTPYFFGVSGATGGGWFQQDITSWNVETASIKAIQMP